jgi:hypothetical protein
VNQLDPLFEYAVPRVVAGSDQTRSDPPTELEAVHLALWLLARDAAERARPGW